VTVVRVPEPAPASGGIHWEDAGLGAGALLAAMLALGGTAAVLHRRRATLG
jgi:hypothetical protein